MSLTLDVIRRTASARLQRLVLAEADDERILGAAIRVSRERIADVTLIGKRDLVRGAVRRVDATLNGVKLADPAGVEEVARTASALRQARGDRLTAADLDRLSRDPLFQAAARVREGLADCFVAGATRTTADVLRAALWLLGLEPGVATLSSFFIIVLPGTTRTPERVLMFTDCAVVPDPTAEQLAEIACLAADHFSRLIRKVPHTAFLSFSTHGSAEHPRVEKVRRAVELARARRPDLHFDGELQLDAAIDPGVGRRKARDSVVAGNANVLVFPDLDSGNIGYKVAQWLGGARAIGPILMGLTKQGNDLSRGCSTEDVVEVATVACALAATRTSDASA